MDNVEKYGLDREILEKAVKNLKEDKVVLYAMSGKMGSGKDTVGHRIKKVLEKHPNEYDPVTLAYSLPMRMEMWRIVQYYDKHGAADTAKEFNATFDNVKNFIKILGGKDPYERSAESRKAIQYWGTDVRRKQNKNYWVNELAKLAVKALSDGYSVEISDVRFENEADSIKGLNGKIIRLELEDEVRVNRIMKRDGLKPDKSQLTHKSETALDDYDFDKIFDGNKEVKNVTKDAVKYLLGE